MRQRHALPSLAVLTLILAGCSGTGGRENVGHGVDAACADIVTYDGQTYWGHGDLARTPATTGRTDEGVREGCDDGNGAEPDHRVRVEELADLPLERGFLVNGQVYVNHDLPFPEAIRHWFASPACSGDAPLELTGRWVGVTSSNKPRFDGDLRPPYRATMWVEEGPERYVGTRIAVRADQGTSPQLGPEDVKRALWHNGRLTARVHCEGGRFLADGLSTSGPR